MFSLNRSGILRTIGVFASILIVLVFVSDAAAQCYCKNTRHRSHHRTASSYKTAKYKTTYAVRGYNAYNPDAAQYRTAYNGDYGTASKYVVVTNGYRRGYNPELVDEEGPVLYDSNYMDTARIGSDWGFHDGLKKGYYAALKRKSYYPEKYGKFHHADHGYKKRYGSKFLYRQAYRDSFVRGYRSGYRSVASRETLRAVRNY